MSDTIRMYWWKPAAPYDNFGDGLSPYLVYKLANKPVECTKQSPKLLAIGSIFENAKSGDTIWGTGIHPRHYAGLYQWDEPKPDLDVRLVRGPRTRKFLLDRGIDCPELYGDPALLLPLFYQPEIKPIHDVGYIPHLYDARRVRNPWHLIDVRLPWREVVNQIVQCRKIVSSSLHGLIVAEAYGLPAIWLRTEIQGEVKYLDYYEGTGRTPRPITNFYEVYNHPGESLPRINTEPILDSFPF